MGVWNMRLQKLTNSGVVCAKIARNGTSARRTFWLMSGCLHTNGRRFTTRPLDELTGVYKGSISQEFQKMKSSTSGFSVLRRLSSRGSVQGPSSQAIEQEPSCVLTMLDRSISLMFDQLSDRDEFVETTTWYAQRLLADKS